METNQGMVFPNFRLPKQDIFGDIYDSSVFRTPNEVFDQSQPPVLSELVETQLKALAKVHFEAMIPHNTDILVLQCRGDGEARHAFLHFWMTADNMQWYQSVGASMQLSADQ